MRKSPRKVATSRARCFLHLLFSQAACSQAVFNIYFRKQALKRQGVKPQGRVFIKENTARKKRTQNTKHIAVRSPTSVYRRGPVASSPSPVSHRLAMASASLAAHVLATTASDVQRQVGLHEVLEALHHLVQGTFRFLLFGQLALSRSSTCISVRSALALTFSRSVSSLELAHL